MIKFFRKLRYDILGENLPASEATSKGRGKTGLPTEAPAKAGKPASRTGRYLKYALGEIILVVIGILIALQINNFNTERQKRAIEQEYLLSLQSEFNTNLEKIDVSIAENTERIQTAEQMLTLFDTNVLNITKDSTISEIIYEIFSGEAFYHPSTGVLTDIISSGNLNLIQNKNLRQLIASFESQLEFVKIQENYMTNGKNELQKLLSKNGSIRKVLQFKGLNFEHESISDTVDNRQLFTQTEFENSLLDYFLTIRAANGEKCFGGIKEHVELILSELDKETK
jgi:hypothetical protein